jgi:serine/threonine protein kinase
MSPDSLLPRGSTIAGRYRLISKLGEGGMGTAYRAWDIQDGVPVVVKMPKRGLLDNPQFAKRFTREIRTMAAVQHPHIVPIVDFGEDGGGEFADLPYVAMRFLPGGSLANRRLRDSDGKPLPNHPSTLHLWLPGIASALDTVHAAGIVHRDVKPANIFFDGFWQAFLGDFGIAKLLHDAGDAVREETLTGTNIGMGTPDFMSPEQFSPHAVIDGRADQYALAVTVYEMLCGSKPFAGLTTHIAVEHLTLPPPLLASRCGGLPPSLCAAVHRGLAKKPAERHPSCSAFVAALLADVKPMEPERDVVRLLCPACSNILKLPPTAGGRTGKCPRCHNVMNVAPDLGALWLEREAEGTAARSDAYSRPISTLTPVSGTTPVPAGNGSGWRSRIDPLVFRVGVGAAAITLLVVWQLLSSHFEEESRKMRLSTEQREHAALEKAIVDRKRLTAENAALELERQKMLAENQRLTTELVRANDAIAKAAEEKAELERKLSQRDDANEVPPRIP